MSAWCWLNARSFRHRALSADRYRSCRRRPEEPRQREFARRAQRQQRGCRELPHQIMCGLAVPNSDDVPGPPARGDHSAFSCCASVPTAHGNYVESKSGAVLPPAPNRSPHAATGDHDGAGRFPTLLIEPDVRFSRIRLSDGFHTEACAGDPK